MDLPGIDDLVLQMNKGARGCHTGVEAVDRHLGHILRRHCRPWAWTRVHSVQVTNLSSTAIVLYLQDNAVLTPNTAFWIGLVLRPCACLALSFPVLHAEGTSWLLRRLDLQVVFFGFLVDNSFKMRESARRCKFDVCSAQAESEVYAPRSFLLPLEPQQRHICGWMCHVKLRRVVQHVV